jgi:histidinol dehydrogenase
MIHTTSNYSRTQFSESAEVPARVRELLQEISTRGDQAIEEASVRFDGFKPQVVSLRPFFDYPLSAELKKSIELAAGRIERFAQSQRDSLSNFEFSDEFGTYSQLVLPLEKMAAYIPGGRFPLISSALMTLIPARVAGVSSRTALSPSQHPALLAAASLAGATKFIHIGGAQAIACAAFGSSWCEAVDVIVGPGNAYVAEAKAQVQSRVRIDSIAGPSEVLILADERAPLAITVEDCIAQSEHGPDALAVLVSTSLSFLESAQVFLQQHSDGAALFSRGQIQLVHAASAQEAAEFSNRFAPEHLMLCDAAISVSHLKNYGALFVGTKSPVALGDYLSGPNHTLPTAGSARRSGGLSVLDFVSLKTTQTIREGAALYSAAAELADAEGLVHHAASLRMRNA